MQYDVLQWVFTMWSQQTVYPPVTRSDLQDLQNNKGASMVYPGEVYGTTHSA